MRDEAEVELKPEDVGAGFPEVVFGVGEADRLGSAKVELGHPDGYCVPVLTPRAPLYIGKAIGLV